MGLKGLNLMYSSFVPWSISLRVLTLILCVHLVRGSALPSVNSSISKTQVLKKEDSGLFENSLSNDVSSRRNLPRCGGIRYVRPNELAFRIFSPDYPLPYPSLLNCVYDIRFQGGSFPCFLDLYFEDFFLSSVPPDCPGDWLEIGGQRFCGGLSGVQRFETEWGPNGQRHLLLRLVSDEVGTGRGFKICVSQVPCSGPLPVPPLYPPPIQPPIIPPQPTLPPFNPPWVPPYMPPSNNLPQPPSYPSYPPWGANVPLCCGTQYQGRHVHLISPGFPAQLPRTISCGYIINRSNPRINQLKIHFKYFFLPCPWVPYQSGVGSPYSSGSRGYFNVDGRNICGCQTGLTITVPFGIFETRKILRFYNPSVVPYSRSQNNFELTSEGFNESSDSRFFEPRSQFGASLNDSTQEKSQNVLSFNGDRATTGGTFGPQPSHNLGTSSLISFPSTLPTSDPAVGGNSQRWDGSKRSKREVNSTSNANSKSGKAFESFFYNNRPGIGPPLGFLIEVIQEEVPYIPGWRRNDFDRVGNADANLAAKLKTISQSSAQNASPRFFHSQSRSCQVSDWPQVKWWLIWLYKKHLLQACPARVPPRPSPPFIPPSFVPPPLCNEPFVPISR
ncbi:uncharacterized protein LOC124168801 [Ischnura elegans]|uniref:uncharacterized protein LOC124168801 n=1 Tax=Ischnura elegans TaxID=197161 RepID=UPI001ED8B61D|nr:uncharacterized protein LOC124168801 [Ischnura elegans]XP_046403070.1 uncharacterized protein LOC124168801 [Ischnura elegans]